MKRLLLLASAFSICSLVNAQTYTEVPLTGFSADVIANGAGSVTTSTTMDMDGAGFAFVSMDFVNPTNQSPTSGLPTNGKINSAATTGLTYQLAPYTGNNSLRISGVNSGTLTFGTPRSADEVYVLATSGSGTSAVTITVTFTDATNQTFTQTVKDWFSGTGYAIQGISRVGHPSNVIENSTINPRLYQHLLAINAASTLKPIQSITFNKTSTGGVLNVMAVTIRATAPAFANDISVSGITGISSGCGLSNQETISISIYNPGSAQQGNFPVSYRINNATPVTENFNGTIAPAGTTTFTFNTKADLSAVGTHNIVARTHLTGDANAANDSTKITAINSLLPGLPVSLDYETAGSGLGIFQTSVKTKSTITEGSGGSNGTGSTKGMIMSGITSSAWVMPVGIGIDPFIVNPEHKAVAKICVSPAGGSASDSLWLTFDLRQLYKTANANTNFRVSVNGTAIGGNTVNNIPPNTYRPPFSGSGTWGKVKLSLMQFITASDLEISFESSVSEDYANGNGPANLVDNIKVLRRIVMSTKDDALQRQLNVYPNPSAGLFTVEIPEGKKCIFEVSDLTGKLIKTQAGVSGINKLKMEGTAKGIYLLKVTSEKGLAFKKIIIE